MTSKHSIAKAPKPTEGELEILRCLWQLGPSTVRQVTDHLSDERPTGYTTVLKMLQIMLGKNLVTRDESRRSHVYSARAEPATTRRQMVEDLMDRAFEGSASRLVLSALSTQSTSREELDEIRRLLDSLEESNR